MRGVADDPKLFGFGRRGEKGLSVGQRGVTVQVAGDDEFWAGGFGAGAFRGEPIRGDADAGFDLPREKERERACPVAENDGDAIFDGASDVGIYRFENHGINV